MTVHCETCRVISLATVTCVCCVIIYASVNFCVSRVTVQQQQLFSLV